MFPCPDLRLLTCPGGRIAPSPKDTTLGTKCLLCSGTKKFLARTIARPTMERHRAKIPAEVGKGSPFVDVVAEATAAHEVTLGIPKAQVRALASVIQG